MITHFTDARGAREYAQSIGFDCADDRARAEAAAFVEAHGQEFGLVWDDEYDCLKVGPRGPAGESRNKHDNTTNHFRGGSTPGQPVDLDRYVSVEVAENASGAIPMYASTPHSRRQFRLAQNVKVILASLKPRYAELLSLRYLEGHTLTDISEAIGITHQAVGSRLKTAEGHFRKAMAAAHA